MALGNDIGLVCNGRKLDVIVSGTPLPGTIMQIQAGTALVGGRPTVEVYNRDADGDRPHGPLLVLDKQDLEGKDETTAYANGDRGGCFVPLAGDEFNLRWSEAGTGTGDSVSVGDTAVVNDGDGLLIDNTGSSETEPFMSLEAVSDVTSTGTLVHCIYNGY